MKSLYCVKNQYDVHCSALTMVMGLGAPVHHLGLSTFVPDSVNFCLFTDKLCSFIDELSSNISQVLMAL